jgi:hypothetical protein
MSKDDEAVGGSTHWEYMYLPGVLVKWRLIVIRIDYWKRGNIVKLSFDEGNLVGKGRHDVGARLQRDTSQSHHIGLEVYHGGEQSFTSSCTNI